MLLDDGYVFDAEEAPPPLLPEAPPHSRAERSLRSLHEMASLPPPSLPPSSLSPSPSPPGPHWRDNFPHISERARGELLAKMERDAPEEALRRLRQLAREGQMSGISAWRYFTQQEREALALPKTSPSLPCSPSKDGLQLDQPSQPPPDQMADLANAAAIRRAESMAALSRRGARERRRSCGGGAAARRSRDGCGAVGPC